MDDLKDSPELPLAIAAGKSFANYCGGMSDEDIDKEYDEGTAHWERLRLMAASQGRTITVPKRTRESLRELYQQPMNEYWQTPKK